MRTSLHVLSSLALAASVWPCSLACSDSHGAPPADHAAGPSAGMAGLPPQEDLAPYREELLEMAMTVASAMPLYPHVKNRSAAQEAVVRACLDLGQPRRALEDIEKIANWRRGVGYAELAFYCARREVLEPVEPCLRRAQEICEAPDEENSQDWQVDRIRSTIAATHLWLGQAGTALDFEVGLEDSEAGRVHIVNAQLLDRDQVEGVLAELETVAKSGSFEQVRGALEATARLFDRFYSEVELREQIESAIQTSSTQLPVRARLELTYELAEFALGHADGPKGLALVAEAGTLLDGARWLPEDQVPLLAKLAELRYRAGDEVTGRQEAREARKLFTERRAGIVDIWRAGALRPLARTFAVMGDRPTALALYKQAVEEGSSNPNSRPRAQDLSATCLSLARVDVEPDTELWELLRVTRDSLGEPW